MADHAGGRTFEEPSSSWIRVHSSRSESAWSWPGLVGILFSASVTDHGGVRLCLVIRRYWHLRAGSCWCSALICACSSVFSFCSDRRCTSLVASSRCAHAGDSASVRAASWLRGQGSEPARGPARSADRSAPWHRGPPVLPSRCGRAVCPCTGARQDVRHGRRAPMASAAARTFAPQ
jgi:hypothetical protein